MLSIDNNIMVVKYPCGASILPDKLLNYMLNQSIDILACLKPMDLWIIGFKPVRLPSDKEARLTLYLLDGNIKADFLL